MDEIDAEKRALRERLAAARAALDPADRAERSRRACHHLLARAPLGGAIAVYAARADEADPRELVAAAERAGAQVLYPRVEGDRLAFAASASAALAPGPFGLREPRGPAVELGLARVIVVPGLGFDRRGQRLGYGRGYYDRALAGLSPRPLLVGFGFEIQLVERLPTTPRDVALDAFVSEAGWLSFAPPPV